jgi:hypothetical protein
MFSNGKWAINVSTVAEAIKELSLLDPDLPPDQDYDGCGTDIVVMNRRQDNAHVQFAEGGFWTDDE